LSRGNLEAIEVLKREACKRSGKLAFAFVDLGSQSHVEALLLASRPDWVIHFASLAFVAESMANPLLYFRNVTENTLNLLRAMDLAKVSNLVYSSSCSTYGAHPVEEMPITEKTPQHPTSNYAIAKMMAEQMIAAWTKQNPTACASILRYFNVVGSDPQGRLGEIQRIRGDNMDSRVSSALFDAASKRISHFKVYGTDFATHDGTAMRDYVHVSDLVAAHLLMLEQQRPSKGAAACGAEIYNVGNGQPTSVIELIHAVQALPGVNKFEPDFHPRRKGDVPIVFADPTKIKSLGWSPEFTNITDALSTAWNFRRMHQNLFPGMIVM
jgi:UDP-arabinose 4-epimerase